MLRSAASISLRHSSRAMSKAFHQSGIVVAPRGNFALRSKEILVLPNNTWSRCLSSQSGGKEESTPKGEDEETKGELVLTPGQKVAVASRLTMWVGILGFASVCAYYIAKELMPTKMSPNTVFNGASEAIRRNDAVTRHYGEKLKFYGKDHGGHREGRRNFIEHTEYTSPDDGSKRTRVRFNVEGQFNNAFCFAEVSSEMPSGEFVYILVQDKVTGRVITVADNRAALTAQRLAGGNKETADAMQQLLGRGGK